MWKLMVYICYTFQNLQIINITYCDTKGLLIFESVTNCFVLLLFLFLFVLSLLTTTVPFSIFRREGLSTYKAALLVILPTPILFIVRVTTPLTGRESEFKTIIWLEYIWSYLLPFIFMVVLFAPTVSPS